MNKGNIGEKRGWGIESVEFSLGPNTKFVVVVNLPFPTALP